MAFTREIKQYEVRCSRCGQNYKEQFIQPSNKPVYCKPCISLMKAVSVVQAKLLKEEFSLEQSDEQIAQQINALLVKESFDVSKENEDLLNSLVEKLVDDEKRRKKLLRQIRKLQNRKSRF